MGAASGARRQRRALRNELGRYVADARPPRTVREEYVAASTDAARRKIPVPSLGTRLGELTVTGYKVGPRGGLKGVLVRCSCRALSHVVDFYNLTSGRTTRCDSCAKKAGHEKLKKYWGYADIVPDTRHRYRLLCRIASCIDRCENPESRNYKWYGARGIRVFWGYDKRAFLAYVVTLSGWDNPFLELDRRDNAKGYEPGNLRFVPRSVNAGNRRTVTLLEKEIDDLRHRLRRAEEQIHCCDVCRAAYCP